MSDKPRPSLRPRVLGFMYWQDSDAKHCDKHAHLPVVLTLRLVVYLTWIEKIELSVKGLEQCDCVANQWKYHPWIRFDWVSVFKNHVWNSANFYVKLIWLISLPTSPSEENAGIFWHWCAKKQVLSSRLLLFPLLRACVRGYVWRVLSGCRWMEKETGGVRVRERGRKGHQLNDGGMWESEQESSGAGASQRERWKEEERWKAKQTENEVERERGSKGLERESESERNGGGEKPQKTPRAQEITGKIPDRSGCLGPHGLRQRCKRLNVLMWKMDKICVYNRTLGKLAFLEPRNRARCNWQKIIVQDTRV